MPGLNKTASKNSDSLAGGIDNDTLNSGTFDDVTLDGGGGNNVFVIPGNKSTTVIGNPEGNDTVRVSTSFDLRDEKISSIENLVYTGTAGALLTGNGGAGSIIGGAGADTLSDGGSGDPMIGGTTLMGGAGNDRYMVSQSNFGTMGSNSYGTAGTLIVESLNGGIDTVESTADFTLENVANVENLVLKGSAYKGIGNSLANLIVSNSSESFLVGMQGSDTIVGGAGDDVIFGAQSFQTLGTIGLETFNLANGQSGSSSVYSLADGSMIMSGGFNSGPDQFNSSFVKVGKNGVLDTTFGTSGELNLADAFGDTQETGIAWESSEVQMLSDGKFLVPIWNTNLESQGYARLTAAGKIDTSFGVNGYFYAKNSVGTGETLLAQFSNGADGFIVAKSLNAGGTKFQMISKDGKAFGTPSSISSNYDFSNLAWNPNVQAQGATGFILQGEAGPDKPVLVRINSSGALDTKFGTGGYLALSAGSGSAAYDYSEASIEVRSNGIYVTGVRVTSNEQTSQAVMSYSAEGKTPTAVVFSPNDDVLNVKVLSDGRIVEVINNPNGMSQPGESNAQIRIYAANGQTSVLSPVLSGFDFSGENAGPEFSMNFEPLIVAQSGKVVLEGRAQDMMSATSIPVLMRLNADGTLDTTFGVNGYFTAPKSKTDEQYDYSNLKISVLADGKLLATGIRQNTLFGESAVIARLTADGKYDASFGFNGVLASEPAYIENPDKKPHFEILSNGSFLLSRANPGSGSVFTLYTKEGKVDANFGSDPLGADSLVGGAGNDALVSGAGVTTMVGGAGDDTYVVNNIGNVIRETADGGEDTVFTTVSHTLAANVENLVYIGAGGATLRGNSLENHITGGNATIYAGAGDMVSGTGGANLYILESENVEVWGNSGGNDTIQSAFSLSLGSENIHDVNNLIYTGTLGATLGGNGRAGVIIGGVGADTLFGGGMGYMGNPMQQGATTLMGGAGNDRYLVSESNLGTVGSNSYYTSGTVIVESLNGGTDTVESTADFTLENVANVENLIFNKEDWTAAQFGSGNSSANLIVGNDKGNTLVGLQGSDTIVGGTGDDVIYGAQAFETLGTIGLSNFAMPNGMSTGSNIYTTADGSLVLQGGVWEGNATFVKVGKNGVVDSTFGNNGRISVSLSDVFGNGANSGVNATNAVMTPLPDGKFLVSGLMVQDIGGVGMQEGYARLTSSGKLDTTFGNNGLFMPSNTVGDGEQFLAQFGNPSDGILVAKTIDSGGTKFQLFSKDGKAVGTPTLISSTYDFADLEWNPSVQLQGTKGVVIQGEKKSDAAPVLVRITTTGILDTTFGSSGYMTLSGGTGSTTYDYSDAIFDVRADAIFVTNVKTGGSTTSEAVMKFSVDGKTPSTVTFPSTDDIRDVKVLNDGRIVAVLNKTIGETEGTQYRIYAANGLTSVLSPVLSGFDFSGQNSGPDFSMNDEPLIVSQSGGKVVLEGRAFDEIAGIYNPVLTRLNSDGTLDTSYGVNGYFTVPQPKYGEEYDYSNLKISVLSDGKLLITGVKQMTTYGQSDVIARLTIDGKYDATFGGNGVLSTEPKPSEPGQTGSFFQVLSNGNILLVTGGWQDSVVTLYTKDGKPDTNFGSDTLGADSLVGGAGNDTLVSGAGLTTMVGGDGDDIYVVNNSADVIRETANGGLDTVITSVSYTLATGVENLIYEGPGGATLKGNSLENFISGGNATIYAGAGDMISGSGGSNLYILESENVEVWGNYGGNDTIQAAFGINLGSDKFQNVNNLVYTGTLGAALTGAGGAGVIVGGAGADTLSAGEPNLENPVQSGSTTLIGGAGNDRYIVSNSDVVIVEASLGGNDTVESASNYTLSGGVENLVLKGEATVGVGTSINNAITGNALANTLNGGLGNDTLSGGEGNDYYIVDNALDVVVESVSLSGGNDTVESAANYTLSGGVENLILKGSATVGLGSSINNAIAGNSLANTLDGGLGNDTLSGEGGNDFYIVDSAQDVVLESNSSLGGNDTIASGVSYTLGGGVENLLLRGTASIGVGSSINNAITGTSLANTLDGGLGNDTLSGGDGNDYYMVDSALDVIVENALPTGGIDTVETNSNYTLSGGVENLVLKGEATVGVGSSINNAITGNALANTLSGGLGNDTLSGGEGNDYYIVDNALDVVVESVSLSGGNDTVESAANYTLSGGVENLILKAAATVGVGSSINNAIAGNSLANTLDGGLGNDTLSGEGGNDFYIVDSALDVVLESNSSLGGNDTIASGVSYTLGGGVENLLLRGTASIGVGSSINNAITGTSLANTLDGGLGNDTLSGGDGNDYYIVDSALDVIVENALPTGGIDTVETNSNYTLSGGVENLVLKGEATVGVGSSINNAITGNALANTLNGGLGNDTLSGGEGNDYYIVDNALDLVVESVSLSGGNDTVESAASYTLSGGVENLILKGSATVGLGSSINNAISGNSLANTLDGGLGDDTLSGEGGNDFYIVESALDVVLESNSSLGGNDTIASGVSYTLSGGVENLLLRGTASIGVGSSINNAITGTSLANTLDGGLGNDTLSGGDGNDYYIVDSALDVIVENAAPTGGIDTVESNSNFTLSGGVENLILKGAVAIGVGNSINNIITGNSLANTLDGGLGNDTLSGGEGNDYYIVDSALDVVVESNSSLGGNDTIASGVSYTLGGGVENLMLRGTAAIGVGSSLNNIITGNSLANTLDGGLGDDTLSGEGGNDFYIVDSALDVVLESNSSLGGNDTIASGVSYTLGGGVENLLLRGAASVGVGSSINNAITGTSLANTLDGGLGNDTLSGEGGNDYYIVDSALDVVFEGATSLGGNDTVESTASYTLSGGVENLLLKGTAAIGVGSSINNAITGNSLSNTLDGGLGNDTLSGEGGNDYYIVDSALDVVIESMSSLGGNDTISSTANYTLSGGVENLILRGTAAIGVGNSLNNIITGNSLANTLDGGLGNDTLSGEGGNDFYIIDSINDIVIESASLGTDSVLSNISGYMLAGNAEVLILGNEVAAGTGNSLANTLIGNASSNTLNGGEGNDSLIGGAGSDYYIIDSLSDTVVEGASAGIDSVLANVTGYTLSGNTDVLMLGNAIASGTGNSLDNFLIGNSISNSLFGGLGNDSLQGAYFGNIAQKDTLTGGDGNDLFILGDGAGCFYDDGDTLTSGTANFAYIVDFNAAQDKLVLSGAVSDYTFVASDTGVAGLTGTGFYGLFREQGAADELVAILKSANSTTLTLANTITNAQFIAKS